MVVPDDIYQHEIDFTALGMKYAHLGKKLTSTGQLNFSDPESIRQLTKALLQRDFNLRLELPEDRLCPPVPNRLNYIVFIQKLVDSTRFDFRDETPSSERVLGLDIGTGASAIYPLLACRQRMNWFFLATEIDNESREYALRNVQANELQSRIRVVAPDGDNVDNRRPTTDNKILPSSQYRNFDDYAIKVQMTNPPFYSSSQEMLDSARLKSRPPNSACTGAPVEMITPGGEVEFMGRIIDESKQPQNRTKIQWFSGMLGKLSSVGAVVRKLRTAETNCTNYVVTEFRQGQKTRRWCVAWSWTDMRPPSTIARNINISKSGGRHGEGGGSGGGGREGAVLDKKHLPPVTEFEFDFDFDTTDDDIDNKTSNNDNTIKSIDDLAERINQEIKSLTDIQWTCTFPTPDTITTNTAGISDTIDPVNISLSAPPPPTKINIGMGKTYVGDTWSRKARRRAVHQPQNQPRNQEQNQNQPQNQEQNQGQEQEDHEMRDQDHEDDSSSSSASDENGENENENTNTYDDKIVFAFRISVFVMATAAHHASSRGHYRSQPQLDSHSQTNLLTSKTAVVHVRWLQGRDALVFESFCGWFKRRIRTPVNDRSNEMR